MSAHRRLEEAGDPGPQGAGQRRRADPEQDVRERRHPRQAVSDPVGHVETDEVLTLAADVEHAAAERERDGEPGEDERRRLEQCLTEVVRRCAHGARRRMEDPVEPGAVEDVAVGEQRVVPGREHDQPAEQEGDERRQDRHDHAARALAQGNPGGERSGLRRDLGRLRHRLVSRRAERHAAVLRPPSISRPISCSDTSPVCSPTISPS